MNHCVAGQEQAIAATSVSGGDAHNSSGYTESSIKRKRLWLLCHSHLLIIPIHHHARCWRSLVTLACLQSGIMSAVGLWWACVLIHKRINQNKVRLTATLGQSSEQRFTSTPVGSHEAAFFTKMSHKLQRATVFCNVCRHPPLWVCFFFFWQWFWMKGAVCLDACGPKAWVHRADSLPQTSSMCLIDFQANLGSFHCHSWIAATKTTAMCSSVTLTVTCKLNGGTSKLAQPSTH